MFEVSVVIPAFNAERLLADTLLSVQAQTMKDIEIIVVNDGSTDSTADIVRGFAEKDPRIRIVSQENGGLAAARNAAWHQAAASCVAFLDAILRAAGYRTGAYTSPHLLRYNERIRINGATLVWEDDLRDGPTQALVSALGR